jgi:SPP1 gp7 family putative phage head morphogenesis protein
MERQNSISWKEAARSGANGRKIYEMLRGNISGGIGLKINQMVYENSTLIKNLPEKIANTINHHIYMQFTQGVRSEAIVEQIRPYMQHAKEYQIERLARTEVSKADTAITRARAEDINLDWYIWKNSQDARVRKSHKIMENVVIPWSEPPSPEILAHEKSEGYYAPGEIYNCRCVALPVVRLEQLTFPIVIYYRGGLHRMGYAQFAGISGLRKLAA